MTWKTILSFIVSATVLTLPIGWLTIANLLPIQAADYSEAERSFVHLAPGSDRDRLAVTELIRYSGSQISEVRSWALALLLVLMYPHSAGL
ncbi:hypothetical protein QUA56_35605 [Microcoleus sp. N3A4]|uniref:hypothetical protein n=1 Tax=Microcoleus sp. N3A4 TaxID=3055379 RepID=UPI002FD0D45A